MFADDITPVVPVQNLDSDCFTSNPPFSTLKTDFY